MMKNDVPQRHNPSLGEIHTILQKLYRAEYPDGAPLLYEALLGRLPKYISAIVRRKLELIVRAEIGPLKNPELQDFFIGKERSHKSLSALGKNALSMFLDPQVLRAYLDVGRDFALSNDWHSIAHFDTQPPIVANELISVAAGEDPDKLKRMGCVFFDVDGTKTLVDCTSHSHAGKYLEGLAEFLCKLPDSVQTWLYDRGLKTEAFTVAGDEFIVVVRSSDDEVTKATLDEFAKEVHKAIAADQHLASFVSFDDPEFAMEYDEWTDEEKKAYQNDSSSMADKLAVSRDKLPDRFVPSVSSGSATLLEALHEALSPDTETAATLEDVGIDAFRLMVARADQRLKEDKREFRETMKDLKWKAFLLRNSENRKLLSEIEKIRFQLRNALREKEEAQHMVEVQKRRIKYLEKYVKQLGGVI